jgi:acetolactate synthase-1/2/3 large subunit
VIGVGLRFDDRVAGRAADFAPGAKVVHVDVDPSAFGRCVRADVPVVGDARTFLGLLDALATPRERPAWLERLRGWHEAHAECGLGGEDGALTTPEVVRALRAVTQEQGGQPTTVVADVGQHQMFAARHYGYDRPGSFFTSGGLGTMGYALPAALGVQLARPTEVVWAVVGDGGFQMSVPELNTLLAEGVPVKVAVVNNGRLGMVRQWQELYYAGHYSHSTLPQPDFARVAESYGCLGLRVERSAEVEPAIERALAHSGPAVVDFRVLAEETVYPMVSPGCSLGEVACVEGSALGFLQ